MFIKNSNRLMRMSPLERSKGRFMRGPDGHEDTVDLDMDAAIADISDSLFGQDESGGGPEGKTVEQPEKVAETPTSDPAPAAQTDPAKAAETPDPNAAKPEGENTQAVQDTGAPKTWTKEAIAEWAAVPPRVQQEILKREQDMFQGLEQYREKAELGGRYDKVVEPFKAVLAAEQVDPVQLFEAFAGNHYLLTRGTPEQKLSLAANMLSHYGIDPTALVMAIGKNEPDPNADPRIAAMEKEIAELRSGQASREQQELNAKREAFEREVNEFANNPDNHYFAEVANDIANLLKTGAATSLPQAYEMAVYSNPGTRAKELDRLASERAAAVKEAEAARVQSAEAAQAVNVKTTTKTRDGTMPVGSLDETLEETMRNINARG